MISMLGWRSSPPPARADVELVTRLQDKGVLLYGSAADEQALPRDTALRKLAAGRTLYTRDDQASAPLNSLADLHTLGGLYLSGNTVAGPIGECLRNLCEAGLHGNLSIHTDGLRPLHRLQLYRTLTQQPDQELSFFDLGLFGASGREVHKLYAQEFFRLGGPDRGTADPVLARRLRDLEVAGYKFSIFKDTDEMCGESAVHIYDRVKIPMAPICMQSKGGLKFPIDRDMLGDIERIRAREQEVQHLFETIFEPYRDKNGSFWRGRAWEVMVPAYREFPNAPAAEAVRGLCELWDHAVTHPRIGESQQLVAVRDLRYAESKKPAWMPLGEAGTTYRQLLDRVPRSKAEELCREIFESLQDDGRYTELRPDIMSLAPYMHRNEYAPLAVQWLQKQPPADRSAACDVARTFIVAGEALPQALQHFDRLFAERRDGQTVHDAVRFYQRVEEVLRPLGQEGHAAEVFKGLQSMVLEPPWRDLGAEAAYEKFTEMLPLHRSALDALDRTRTWQPPEQAGSVERQPQYVRLNGVTVAVRSTSGDTPDDPAEPPQTSRGK